MKCSRIDNLKAFAAATICMFVWSFVVPHAAFCRTVEIPPMTSLQVATLTAIDPAAVNVGDQVSLQVTKEIKIDDVTVIKAGARVLARVTQAKEQGMIGIPAAVGLVLESVEAVDGTMIPISGSKNQEGKNKMVVSIGLALVCCILFALMKGGSAEIPAGTQIMANTTMKAMIAT